MVDDDLIFRESVEKNLIAEGYEIVSADNGKVALNILKSNNFDLIFTDVKMPEMDGVDLTKAIRKSSLIPIIMTTGFSELLETKAAYELGVNEFIPKPFKSEDLFQAIQQCLAGSPSLSPVDLDSQYCKLGINDFVTGKTIKFNIFARLSANKYVKLAHKGEDLSINRVRFYREKGMRFLYLRIGDFREYVGFSLTLAKAAQKSDAIARDKKLNLLRHTGEILNEQIRHDGIDDHVYESAGAFVDATLNILSDDFKALEVLDALRNHADYVLAHSVGVSMYAVMIAQNIQWQLPSNKIKVAMGGLFHDIGIKELHRDLIDRPRYQWNVDDVKTYESHPTRGHEILIDIQSLPDDVLDIVKQHHENCLSRGYPAGMKKALIHPMAKLISVADEFCYRVIKNPQYTPMSPADALQDMASNCAAFLDKKFFEALVQLFRPATKNAGPGFSVR